MVATTLSIAIVCLIKAKPSNGQYVNKQCQKPMYVTQIQTLLT